MTTLTALAAQGRLVPRDLDVLLVGLGTVTVDDIQNYVDGVAVADRGFDSPRQVVEYVVERICEAQAADGGRTSIVENRADASAVLRVHGPCEHCPLIRYTSGIVESAIRLLWPDYGEVSFVGIDLESAVRLPDDHQLNMQGLMRSTGLTFADLDEALARFGVIDDDVVERVAQRSTIQRLVMGPRSPDP